MIRWNLNSNVGDVLELGPRAAGRLGTLGVRTVGDLLHADAASLADGHYDTATLVLWQREARLRIEAPDMPPTAARCLALLGIASAEQLRCKSPTELVGKWETATRTESAPAWFQAEKKPTIAVLCAWIATAREKAPKSVA